MISLREFLKDAKDFDVTMHYLGVLLGVFPVDSKMSDFKHVFWSNNLLGNRLLNIIDRIAYAGFLEYNDETLQYKWVNKD